MPGQKSDSAEMPHASCLRPELFVLMVGGGGAMEVAQARLDAREFHIVTACSHQ